MKFLIFMGIADEDFDAALWLYRLHTGIFPFLLALSPTENVFQGEMTAFSRARLVSLAGDGGSRRRGEARRYGMAFWLSRYHTVADEIQAKSVWKTEGAARHLCQSEHLAVAASFASPV